MHYLVCACVILALGPILCTADTAGEIATEEEAVDKALSTEVASGTSAVAIYLGFNCPAGYRCLPVLECLPCDYGSYKSDTSSKLCTLCPTGCTTLRKGASSWRECVPMCPPGYETSECGKTCIKCQPGYYKSTWLNTACQLCPASSHPDTVTLAMTSVDQCYGDEPDDEVSSSEPTDGPLTCPDTACESDGYSTQTHIPLIGSNCEKWCHCENDVANGTYKYTEKDCGPGTMWIVGEQVCHHADVYKRSCTADGLVSATTTGTDGETSACKAICEGTDVTTVGTEYRMVPNTGCSRFCACGAYPGTEVYWQEMQCEEGTIAVENEIGVICEDGTTGQFTCSDAADDSNTYSSSPAPPGQTSPSATAGGRDGTCPDTTCESDGYSTQTHIPLIGSNCEKWCHCENDVVNGTYKYTEKDCGPGTMWIVGEQVCHHADVYKRSCTADGLVSATTTGTDGETSACKAICEGTDVTTVGTEYRMVPNTGCSRFCACGAYPGTEVYWQEMQCEEGTVAVETEIGVICEDGTTGQYTCSDAADDSNTYSSSPAPPGQTSPSATAGGRDGTCPDTACESDGYSTQTHIPLIGSNCEKWCHCENDVVNGTYKYTEKDCGPGTMWIVGEQVCHHADVYKRSCAGDGLVSDAPSSSGDQTSMCKAICEGTDLTTAGTEYRMVPNSGCSRFCVCGVYPGPEVYWQELQCDEGFIAVEEGIEFICRDEEMSTCVESEWSQGSSAAEPTAADDSNTYSSSPAPSGQTSPSATAGGRDGTCPDTVCQSSEYSSQTHIPLIGSNCKKWCQCENDVGNGTHKYTEKNCGDGTMWIVGQQVCHHADDYRRSCTGDGLVSDAPASSGDQTSVCKAICEGIDPTMAGTEYRMVPNSGCSRFCGCGVYPGSEVYWQELQCEEGFIAMEVGIDFICQDEELPSSVCVESEWSQGSSTAEPAAPTCPDTLCQITEYSSQTHIPLIGSNCKKWCHCENDEINGTFKYTEKECAEGTLWLAGRLVCYHADIYHRSCRADGLVNTTDAAGAQTSQCKAICSEANVSLEETSTMHVPNTDCGRFCVCGAYPNGEVYWQELECEDGFIAVDADGDFQCKDTATAECHDEN